LGSINKFALSGSMISSKAFKLRDEGLPSFLGGFKFSNDHYVRNKK